MPMGQPYTRSSLRGPPAWAESGFAGKIAFLRRTQDQALPLFPQDMFTEKSGVKWRIEDIDASHSPWASRPEETIRVLGV